MKITKALSVDVDISSYELAWLFCNMACDEQSSFFNTIARIVDTEWDTSFCFQLQAITDSSTLTLSGRSIMSQIGEYSQEQK